MNPTECEHYNKLSFWRIIYPDECDACYNCIHHKECKEWLLNYGINKYGQW